MSMLIILCAYLSLLFCSFLPLPGEAVVDLDLAPSLLGLETKARGGRAWAREAIRTGFVPVLLIPIALQRVFNWLDLSMASQGKAEAIHDCASGGSCECFPGREGGLIEQSHHIFLEDVMLMPL